MGFSASQNGHATSLPELKTYSRIEQVLDVPNLIQSQLQSYDWFKTTGLQEVYKENLAHCRLHHEKVRTAFSRPLFPGSQVLDAGMQRAGDHLFSAIVRKDPAGHERHRGDKGARDFSWGDIPMMSDNGHLHHKRWRKRVVVSQLVRSPGIYFVYERNAASNRNLCFAKLIPSRGAWLEFETSAKDVLSVKVDRKRKVSATTFLRALGIASDEEILDLFADVDTDEVHQYISLHSGP